MLAAPHRTQVVENLMGVGAWRVALVINLDAISSLDGAWVRVTQKSLESDAQMVAQG